MCFQKTYNNVHSCNKTSDKSEFKHFISESMGRWGEVSLFSTVVRNVHSSYSKLIQSITCPSSLPLSQILSVELGDR